MAKIVVIGAGVMGCTACIPACDNGHNVAVVGTPFDREIIVRLSKDRYHLGLKRKLPEALTYHQFEELSDVLEGTELVIAGISSFGVDWFTENALPKICDNTPVLLVTKGLRSRGNGEICSFVEHFEEVCNKRVPFYAIGGPCISYELADRHNTFVGICGFNKKDLDMIKNILETPYYHINTTTDVAGFEMASAIKNIYALAVSMAIGVAESKEGIGCRPHYNALSGLLAQSIREMEIIIKCFGGNAEKNIVYGVADLYITIESGRNREIGVLLGRGLTIDETLEKLSGVTLESVSAVKALSEALELKCSKGEFNMQKLPLFSHVQSLMTGEKTVDIPWYLF